MHIAAEVEGEAVKVEVRDIPTGRKITGLALVDATGHETPAREREIVTREESGGGNAGPGVGIGASGGSSSGIRPFISLGYLFSGDSGVRSSPRLTDPIPLDDPAPDPAGHRDRKTVREGK